MTLQLTFNLTFCIGLLAILSATGFATFVIDAWRSRRGNVALGTFISGLMFIPSFIWLTLWWASRFYSW